MKVKTSELIGTVLDWAVATCEGWSEWEFDEDEGYAARSPAGEHGWLKLSAFAFSTDWSQGGPIIEREGITVIRCDNDYGTDERGFCNSVPIPVWCATTGHHTIYESREGKEIYTDALDYGPSPLIAAMRCYVAAKLGEEVEVPEELL